MLMFQPFCQWPDDMMALPLPDKLKHVGFATMRIFSPPASVYVREQFLDLYKDLDFKPRWLEKNNPMEVFPEDLSERLGVPILYHDTNVRNIREACFHALFEPLWKPYFESYCDRNCKLEHFCEPARWISKDHAKVTPELKRVSILDRQRSKDIYYFGWLNFGTSDDVVKLVPSSHIQPKLKNPANGAITVRIAPGEVFLYNINLLHTIQPLAPENDIVRLELGCRVTRANNSLLYPTYGALKRKFNRNDPTFKEFYQRMLVPPDILTMTERAIFPGENKELLWSFSNMENEADVRTNNYKFNVFDVYRQKKGEPPEVNYYLPRRTWTVNTDVSGRMIRSTKVISFDESS